MPVRAARKRGMPMDPDSGGMDLAVPAVRRCALMSGQNVTITVVIEQVNDLDYSRELIARIHAGLHESGVDFKTYVNNPLEPNHGPWD